MTGSVLAYIFRAFRIRLALLLVLLTAGAPLGATPPERGPRVAAPPTTAEADSTRAVRPATVAAPVRRPDAARLAALRARADLRYQPPGYRPRLTAWERFWRWFWDRMGDVFGSSAAGRTYKVLWYVFLVGTLAWVILNVLNLDVSAVFGRAPRAAPAYDVDVAESPFTDDLADRLADAEARGDLRLATRLGYLLALRRLADRDLIRWLPEKTNTHYLHELPAGPARDAFAALTRQFELAWYGEVVPTAAEYAAARETRAALARAIGALTGSAPAAPAVPSPFAAAA